jgi:hypothetical protein
MIAVAHGLTHRDHVGDEAVTLKAPHLLSRAGEARLHLVGNEHAARFAHARDCFGHESGLARIDAVAREDAVGNKPGEADFLSLHGGNRL